MGRELKEMFRQTTLQQAISLCQAKTTILAADFEQTVGDTH